MTVLEFIKNEIKEIEKINKKEKIVHMDVKVIEDHYLPYTNTINGGK